MFFVADSLRHMLPKVFHFQNIAYVFVNPGLQNRSKFILLCTVVLVFVMSDVNLP